MAASSAASLRGRPHGLAASAPSRSSAVVQSRVRPRRRLAVHALGTPGRDVLSGEYDASTNASVWERRPVPVIKRLIRIGVEFLRWQIQYPDDPAPPPNAEVTSRPVRTPRKTRRAAAMRDVLVRLGPAFVKIGQALSSRPDILPPAYLVELEALQDRIPAFETSVAFTVIEDELGAPLRSVFSEISPQPIAAASLGQVYRAVLARDGQVVAVKVQRPGVAEAIALDVFILRWLAAVFRQLRKLNTDLPSLVDEWATSLFRELDYRREARNAARFQELYSQLEGVYVPTVFAELTTAKVLTMEWVDGERLRTVADNITTGTTITGPSSTQSPSDTQQLSDRRRSGAQASTSGGGGGAAVRKGSSEDLTLVEVGVRCSLEQMLEQGFYHADPHPGNLLRTKDGRLAYLDFGMCGELDTKTSQALIRATLHLVNREYSSLAQDFIDLGLLPQGSDKEKIIPALTGVFQKALSRGVSNVSFGDLSGELGRTMYQFKFRIPPYYTLLVRSLTVLEGIALASDPNYKVLGSAYPWIARRLLTNRSPELRETLRALLYTSGGTFRFSRLESLLQEAVRMPRALPPAMSPGPLNQAELVATRDAQQGDALSLLLSPEASFVRDILVDELAKGVDAAWRVGVDTAVNSARHPLPLVANPVMAGMMGLAQSIFPGLRGSTGSNNNNNTSNGSTATGGVNSLTGAGLEDRELAGPVGALLASLPELSSSQDRQQLAGLQRLTVAVGNLATAHAQSMVAAQEPGMPATALSGVSPATLAGLPGGETLMRVQQAAEALRWLVTEVTSLPDAQRAEALKLPVEIASRVASRLAARAIRGFAGGSDAIGAATDEDSSETPSATVTETVTVVEVVPTSGPRQMMGSVQDTLAGSSIV